MITFKKSDLLQLFILFSLVSFAATAQIAIHNGGDVSMGGNPGTRPACKVFVDGPVSGNAMFIEGNTGSGTTLQINGGTNVGYSFLTVL